MTERKSKKSYKICSFFLDLIAIIGENTLDITGDLQQFVNYYNLLDLLIFNILTKPKLF